MVTRALTSFLVLLLLVACNEHITDARPRNPQSVSVLTQHNDNTRSGLNDHETLLTTSNVDAQHFGRQFSLAVDDEVYAQPLVVGSVAGISNGQRNVVYVATVANTVYAFDGDDGRLYWQQNFTAPGMRPPRNTDMTGACNGNYPNFSGNMGIVGTPVIDAARGVMYFVARSTNGTQYAQYLHAVSIAGGTEMAGSPVLIAASVTGNGDGNNGGFVAFEPQKANQRQALSLVNGRVYVSFSSHCDWGPYHGWILGYDAATLQRQIVYNDTPDGYAGGMWESGMGMAADAQGNLYVTTGNGTVGVGSDAANPRNRSESALKLTPSGSTLQVSSFFTPANYQLLNDYDLDYGVMGSLLIPGSNYYFTAAKDGTLYLLDKDDMGGVSASDQAREKIPLTMQANLHAQPAYYKGSAQEFVYVWSEGDPLRAFPFDRGSNLLDVQNQVVMSGGPGGQSGAVLSVSSNGTQDGTGILWASYAYSGDAESFVTPGILRAFDANDVTHELWSNRQNFSRDGAGNYAKFSSPTIANGHVYLPTFSHQVVVYGLLQ
jgi:hypothetical protein